jgi:ankyrin repeat protein
MARNGALIKAVIDNDTDLVRSLLTPPHVQADINMKDGEPLIRAARNGYTEMTELLLSFGAKPEARRFEALRHAASGGYLDVVKILLATHPSGKNGIDSCDFAPLRHAAENGHLEVVRFLRELGSDVTACDNNAIRRANRNGHVDVVHYLRSEGAILP